MRRFVSGLLLSCAGLALAACSSAPTHFYTLMPPPASTASTSETTHSGDVDFINVLPVGIPAQVDRPQMVVRGGGGQVALLEGERWIAPLGDEIRNALSIDLTGLLSAEDVSGLAQTDSDKPVYRVKVNINRFESIPGNYTQMDAMWSVQRVGGHKSALVQCSSQIRESVGQGYAALAEGHQRGIKQLAGRVANMIRRMAQGLPVVCRSH